MQRQKRQRKEKKSIFSRLRAFRLMDTEPSESALNHTKKYGGGEKRKKIIKENKGRKEIPDVNSKVGPESGLRPLELCVPATAKAISCGCCTTKPENSRKPLSQALQRGRPDTPHGTPAPPRGRWRKRRRVPLIRPPPTHTHTLPQQRDCGILGY